MKYVLIQFSLLIYMASITNWAHLSFISVVLILLAILLGFWAIFSVGLNNITIFPEPKKNIKLQMNGPYRWIRHPMYTSVLLFSLGMVIMKPIYLMYTAYFLLILDLVFKLRYEEKKLTMKFKEYNEYRNRTYTMVPFIY